MEGSISMANPVYIDGILVANGIETNSLPQAKQAVSETIVLPSKANRVDLVSRGIVEEIVQYAESYKVAFKSMGTANQNKWKAKDEALSKAYQIWQRLDVLFGGRQ